MRILVLAPDGKRLAVLTVLEPPFRRKVPEAAMFRANNPRRIGSSLSNVCEASN